MGVKTFCLNDVIFYKIVWRCPVIVQSLLLITLIYDSSNLVVEKGICHSRIYYDWQLFKVTIEEDIFTYPRGVRRVHEQREKVKGHSLTWPG